MVHSAAAPNDCGRGDRRIPPQHFWVRCIPPSPLIRQTANTQVAPPPGRHARTELPSLRLSNHLRREVCSILAVTGDLALLCDRHHAPMRRSLTIPLKFQGCTGDQFCKRRYHPLIGYYAGVSPTASYEVYCVTHFPRPLYVYAYDAKHRLKQYACPVPGCENITECRELRATVPSTPKPNHSGRPPQRHR